MIDNKNFVVLVPVLLLFLFVPGNTFSQNVKVKNVFFEQDKEKIFISYDLFGAIDKKFKVSLSLSNDKGKSYRIIPKAVHGDIGDDVVPGIDKQIIWEFTKDYPGGLQGEDFVFAVDAELLENEGNIKNVLLIGGLGAAGAVVYFLVIKKDKGSVNIIIPGDVY